MLIIFNRKNKFKVEVGLGMLKFIQIMLIYGELSVEGIIENYGFVDKDGFIMYVSLENLFLIVRKLYSCLEICELVSNIIKFGKIKIDQFVLKEKFLFYLIEIVIFIVRSLLIFKEFKK